MGEQAVAGMGAAPTLGRHWDKRRAERAGGGFYDCPVRLQEPRTLDPLAGLSARQAEAAGHRGSPLLIVAGPGSGKTRVIVHRIAFLLQQAGQHPENIVAVTFTRKAAGEIRDRLALLLGPDGRRVTAGTFHALCARWLRADGELISIPPWASVFDEADAVKLIGQALRDCGIPSGEIEPARALDRIARAKSRLLTVERFTAHAESPAGTVVDRRLVPVYARYQALLSAQAALDFDDLILRTIVLFHHHPEVLARYQAQFHHVLVDEFQDTSIAEFQLLHQLIRARSDGFTAVFDDDQAIFAWREADVRNVARAASLPRARIVHLDQNYRSQANIVAAAAGVIGLNADRRPKSLWTDNPSGAPLYLHEAKSDVAEASFVASTIRQLHDEHGVPYRACAVLFRANALIHKLETAFLRARLPYRLVRSVRFYERAEVKDLLAYLRVALNPLDTTSLERIVNVPARGLGAVTLARLHNWSAEQGVTLLEAMHQLAASRHADDPRITAIFSRRSRERVGAFIDVVDELRTAAALRTPAHLLGLVLRRTGYQEHIRARTSKADGPTGEERWKNVLALRAIAREYDEQPPGEGLAAFLTDTALMQDIDALDPQADAVPLLTIHSAKGLEFPVVFIVGMDGGIFPRTVGRHSLEEERRLFYVALTRARHAVFLSGANWRTQDSGPTPFTRSPFVREIPPRLIQRLETDGASAVASWLALPPAVAA